MNPGKVRVFEGFKRGFCLLHCWHEPSMFWCCGPMLDASHRRPRLWWIARSRRPGDPSCWIQVMFEISTLSIFFFHFHFTGYGSSKPPSFALQKVVFCCNSWTRFVNRCFPKSSGTKDFPLRAWRWQVSGRKNLKMKAVQTSHCLRFWKENPEVGEMIISSRIGLTIDYPHSFPGISLFSRLSRLVSTLSFALDDSPENLRLTCLIFTIQHLGFFQEIIRQKPAKRTWFEI